MSHSQADSPSDPNSVNGAAVRLLGADRSILVVGPDISALTTALTEAGNRVTALVGNDPVAESDQAYDAVVLDGVLHAHPTPSKVLADFRCLLAAGGSLVVTIPNPAHAAARLRVLQGQLPTQEAPLTGDSLCSLLEGEGWEIAAYQATMADALDPRVSPPIEELRSLPPGVIEWVRHQPEALCLHFLVLARPLEVGATPAQRPALEPLAPAHEVRQVDEFTEQRRASQADAQRSLTQRDHIIGLEARAAAARARQREAEDRSARLEARAKRLKEQLNQFAEAVEELPRGRGQEKVRALAAEVSHGRGGNG